MKKKKKRRIRIKRLLFLIVVLLLIIALVIIALVSGYRYIQKKQEEARIAEVMSYDNTIDLGKKRFKKLQNKAIKDDNYLTILENLDSYSTEIIEFLLEDDDRLDFVLEYPDRDNYQDTTTTLTEDLSEVPSLLQWDIRWGYITYGENIIAKTGCAPTCLSMVFSYLLNDSSITPIKIAEYSMNNDFYVEGSGSSWELLTQVADEYNVNVYQVPVSKANIKSELESGRLLIFSMEPGDFTKTGHFIVACGTKNGKVVVHDPNSIKRTNQLWDYDVIIPQIKNIWSYANN